MSATKVRPSYLRVLRHRPVRFLWIAQVISQSGDFIFDIALVWLVILTTGSAASVGITIAVILLPTVFLGPVAGVYIDRINRRTIMITTEIFQGAVVLGLASLLFLHELSFIELLVLVFLLNAGATLTRVSTTALIPAIVSKDDLGAANGLFSFSGSFNQLASLGLGGVVVALLGVETPILYDGVTFFAAVALLLLIPVNLASVPAQPSDEPKSARRTFFGEFRQGFTYVGRSRLMLELVAIAVLLNFFGAMMTTLIGPFAKFVLDGNAAAYGFLGASIALGSMAGSFGLGKIDMRRSTGPLLFSGIFLVGASSLVWGFAHTLDEALLVTLVVGVGIAAASLPISVLVQAKVPNQLLGRVGTALGAGIAAGQPAGALVAGILAGNTDVGRVYVLCGASVLVIGAIGYALLKELRQASY